MMLHNKSDDQTISEKRYKSLIFFPFFEYVILKLQLEGWLSVLSFKYHFMLKATSFNPKTTCFELPVCKEIVLLECSAEQQN